MNASPSSPSRRAEPRPEIARAAAIVLLVALGIGAIAAAAWCVTHGGIGWDARGDTKAALAIRSVDTSWSRERAYAAVPGNSELYGAFLQQFADALHRLLTGSSRPLMPDDPTTYRYQASANLILAVASVTALACALFVAFRSVLAAAFAWSLTLSTPLWLGMSHVDFKDVPVAAGITCVTAGLVLALSLDGSWPRTLAGVLLAGAGGAVAVATRAGSGVLLVGLIAGTALLVAFRILLTRRREVAAIRVVPALIVSACALLCALAFTWVTNPIARIDTLAWLRDASSVAGSFPWDGSIRTAGRDLQSDALPWWYVPAWLGAQLPLLTLVGMACALVAMTGRVGRGRADLRHPTLVPAAPILVQAIVLPVLIVYVGSILYDGIRHLLFMIPALIALAAVPLAVLDRYPTAVRSRPRALAPTFAVALVAVSLFGAIRWAPYSYAFVNAVAGHDTTKRSWELDYWGVSGREGVTRLEALGLTPVRVQPTNEVGIPWETSPRRRSSEAESGLYVFIRLNRAADFGCSVVLTIERGGHVLGEGARCPATASK